MAVLLSTLSSCPSYSASRSQTLGSKTTSGFPGSGSLVRYTASYERRGFVELGTELPGPAVDGSDSLSSPSLPSSRPALPPVGPDLPTADRSTVLRPITELRLLAARADWYRRLRRPVRWYTLDTTQQMPTSSGTMKPAISAIVVHALRDSYST